MVYSHTVTPKELQVWRKKNSYSQSQLARALGVATQTVSRWERGVREIPSFLHLALECLESKGGELKTKGKKTKKERREEK
jgi:DNA-binding transcriptional regulator YiaG